MTGPKSLLEVKDGRTFLDVIAAPGAGAARALRRAAAAGAHELASPRATTRWRRCAATRASRPTCRWTSCRTRSRSSRADDLQPVSWPADPGAGVVPARARRPLHRARSLRDARRAARARLPLGLRVELRQPRRRRSSRASSPGWRARSCRSPMEAPRAPRPTARAGTSPARRDGGLVLRETAQTPDGGPDAFQDVGRHRYFNTNNLWVDLRGAARHAATRATACSALPMIVNRKTVDPARQVQRPRSSSSRRRWARRSASSTGARALRVPRTRFAPVKTTNDLLVLRSDAYELHDGRARRAGARRATAPPVVDARRRATTSCVADFEQRFPAGPPSLRGVRPARR